jgi:hypothetical protein
MEPDSFADAVNDLYTRIRKDIPSEPGAQIPPDVAAVAFPLATLRGALDVLFEHLVANPERGRIKRSQIIPALHLFDSLMRGAEHPFWRYSKAMQASTPHRRPPSEVEIIKRGMGVGLLRALMRVYGSRSESKSGVKIETACLKRGIKIKASQLSEWNTQFQTTHADDPEPDRFASRFSTANNGKPITDPDRILANGVHSLDEFFGKANF